MRFVALVGVLVLAGMAKAAIVPVEITSSMKFSPNHIQVRAGDTVVFTNNSTIRHTVTADPSLAADPANVVLPAGAAPFNSGAISPGKTFSQVLTVPGLYQYVCLPHERHGMMGQIEVVAAEFETDFESL